MGFGYVTAVLTVCIYAIASYNCVKVLTSGRTTSSAAIAWVLFHLILPVVAIPLYLLLGDFRIKGYVKRHRQSTQQLETAGSFVAPQRPPEPEEVAPLIRANYGSFRRIFRKFGPIFEPQPGDVRLLVDGKSTFTAIFAAIAAAQRSIFVQYYIVRHDRLGLELKRLLIEKAKAGVPVYLLYDDMGSFWLSRDYIRDLRANGVEVERFLPIASFKRFFQMNFRNHRKLVAVDGHVAFTGGLNVGEEYAAPRSRKSQRYWRDTHMMVTGGAVAHLEEIFFEDWYFASGAKLSVPEKGPLAVVPPKPAELETYGSSLVQVVPTGPTDEALISVMLVLHTINVAAQRLWIATPYFVPDQAILRALELAVLRGVDVRIVLPRVSDNRLVHWVSLSYADQLRQRGIKVMLYELGFMHQKVILVDDGLTAIGTMNMDNRAMYLNFETMILIHDEAFNQSVADMLRQDFLACRYLSPNRNRLLRTLEKMRGNAARVLAPIL